LLYKLTNAEYGFIAYNIGNENVDKAEQHLKKAINYAEKLIESGKYQSEAYALQGAFYAFKIGLNPIVGAIWGPKSLKSINKAMQLDASNPTAWLEKANSLYYMPEAFGGSKESAILHYKRAVNIYEKQGEILNNWMYLNTLTTLAQGYENVGKHEQAKKVYKKILSIEPNFDWVKNELYPKLLAKIND
jgi:tetratricopeptide (TPR) repeat protein